MTDKEYVVPDDSSQPPDAIWALVWLLTVAMVCGTVILVHLT
jgi:hypothetical protein